MITRVNKLPVEIIQMAIRLADLEVIKFVKIYEEALFASSENYPKRPKVPITNMSHETTVGLRYFIVRRTKQLIF